MSIWQVDFRTKILSYINFIINIYNVGTIVIFKYVKSYDTISNSFVTFLAYLLIYLLKTKHIIIDCKSKKMASFEKKNNIKFIKKKKKILFIFISLKDFLTRFY